MMKMKLVYITIILTISLNYSCSNSTFSEGKPSLGDLLYGTYDIADAQWSPNPNGNPRYITEPTALTFLSLNSNRNYSMKLELYVAQQDTIFNIYQEGSYVTMGTEYVEPSGWGVDHWKGTLEFRPAGETGWEVDFLIYKNSQVIIFQNVNEFLFELPNSGGFIWVTRWQRLK